MVRVRTTGVGGAERGCAEVVGRMTAVRSSDAARERPSLPTRVQGQGIVQKGLRACGTGSRRVMGTGASDHRVGGRSEALRQDGKLRGVNEGTNVEQKTTKDCRRRVTDTPVGRTHNHLRVSRAGDAWRARVRGTAGAAGTAATCVCHRQRAHNGRGIEGPQERRAQHGAASRKETAGRRWKLTQHRGRPSCRRRCVGTRPGRLRVVCVARQQAHRGRAREGTQR